MKRVAKAKAHRRLKRRRRRQRIARLALLLFLLFSLRTAAAPSASDLNARIESLARADRFDLVAWISQALGDEAGRRLYPPNLPATYADQRTLVDTYLAQEAEIWRQEQAVAELYATTKPPAQRLARLEQTLRQLRQSQAELIPQVEYLLSRQVETVLLDEGFGWRGQLFPPVAFRLIDPPTSLILSPRVRIEKQESWTLQPSLDYDRRTALEDTLHQRGDVSAYVTNIGGLGSYPTMVINSAHLPILLEIIAHEWTHNYLYTFPTNMAWGYQLYPRLTTINETTASLVGEEISRKVIARFYPDWLPALPPIDALGQPVPLEPSPFERAMQRIRRRVDHLLAAGQVEEAEAYMESERAKLVEQGYNLRRLNQAYFAFHGVYALSPAAVDPLGPQIRQLRAESPSLKAFLDQVGWLNSFDDYQLWLNTIGIESAKR